MARSVLVWTCVALAVAVPVGLAAVSPLLAWRDWIYVTAGFAGIVGLALMLLQPLLVAGILPGLTPYQSRRTHHWIGAAIVLAVFIHVGGLYLTSPPDVIDVLVLNSPTPFAVWGLAAMWAVIIVAVLTFFRHRLRLMTWRRVHSALALVIVVGTVVHTVLIEGAMEIFSKVVLCGLVVLVSLKVIADLKVWQSRKDRQRPRASAGSGPRSGIGSGAGTSTGPHAEPGR